MQGQKYDKNTMIRVLKVNLTFFFLYYGFSEIWTVNLWYSRFLGFSKIETIGGKAFAANEYPWSQWIPPLVSIFETPKKREYHRLTVQISLNTVIQNKKNMWGFIWNLILVIFVLKWRGQNITVHQPYVFF